MRPDALIAEWERWQQLPFQGWDFSRLQGHIVEDALPWDYTDLARQAMRRATAALDLGTGGGEILASFQDAYPARVAATEGYAPNLKLARERLGPLGVEVLESQGHRAEILPFADASFDLVLNRHSGYNLADVIRVLSPGGVYLTQQVDGHTLQGLITFFDAQTKWPDETLARNEADMHAAGLLIEAAREWSGRTEFKSVGALVYFLRAIPWMVDDFSVERHRAYLLRLQERLERGAPLAFTQRRYLIRARKPDAPLSYPSGS